MDDQLKDNMLVLTPSALLTFLANIEELRDLDIDMVESDSTIQVKIGESIYTLESPEDSEIQINGDAVEELDDINEEGYDELANEDVIDHLEEVEGDVVEGGVIKELIKTLAVGGLVRLTKGAIMDS